MELKGMIFSVAAGNSGVGFGIHSMELKAEKLRESNRMLIPPNPFNGIESSNLSF